MREKLDFSLDTCPNSPSRIIREQVSKQPSGNNFIMNNSTYYSNRMSETESEIYSHGLIREVMEASRAKSIWHDISRIDQESALYSLPLKKEPYEYQIDSIPPKNQLFLSACSATIKNINADLAPEHHHQHSARHTQKRPSSALTKMDTHNKKISVSGLVTYNFNSVLTKKSLGFSQINHEEKMLKDIKTARDKLQCSKERGNRILQKSSGPRFRKSQKQQIAIMSKQETDTDAYLKNIILEKQANTMIYSQRTKKINCVRQYMEQEKVDYDMAVHAVTIIDGNHKKIVEKVPIPVEKIKQDEQERQLSRRRIPSQRKPVLIRHFYFIE